MSKPPWELEDDEPLPVSTTKMGGKKAKRVIPKGRQTATGGKSFTNTHVSGALHGQSKYLPEYPELLIDYFDVNKTCDDGQIVTGKGVIVNGVREGSDMPTIPGFCAMVRISRLTYHRWSSDTDDEGVFKYPGFAEAAEVVKCMQQDLLISNGLKGKYNASLTKFILNTHHEMIEKTSSDVKISGGINITISPDDEDL